MMPEIQLILYFLNGFSGGNSNPPLPDTEHIDWDLFLSLAADHKADLLIFKSADADRLKILPDHIQSKLKARYIANLKRSVRIAANAIEIINILNVNGILCFPFKGAFLSEAVYGDLALRYFEDIDLLISKQDAVKTVDILSRQGFIPNIRLEPEKMDFYSSFKASIDLGDPASGLIIDLHWDITGNYSIRPLDLQHICKTRQTFRFLNKSLPAFSRPDLLTCLCMHGAKNIYPSLERIFCITRVLREFTEQDHEQLLTFARETKCQKIISLGLHLSRIFFPAQLTDSTAGKIHFYPNMTAAALAVSHTLTEDKKVHGKKIKRFSWFHFSLMDTAADRVTFASRLLFFPTIVDWKRFSFPNYLIFLHFLTRPVRLATNALKKVACFLQTFLKKLF